ncbi:acetyltransferase GNAT family protein [Asticcacaulis biprosthecium C19]|uniref:Acetyltransferase GNAT family protein n=1 Tax=Asticcacaulis biprosthecium C19 TaxID=715226 RepID=F4QQR8_9CAUL|nr:GNAT family N-acetyltransferase [Asticcacaulis biprosthecium]EGF90555.1 acetyltransferase GNAT family protein [Asticcacaulis biprosthecium C19]
MPEVKLAVSEDDFRRCFPVIQLLRPHVIDADDLIARIDRQRSMADWRLAYVEDAGAVVACAGFRVHEWLVSGKILYVDDLVTIDEARSKGYGKNLLNWMKDLAREEGCAQLRLDSGTHRTQAHKFYFREGLTIQAFHFETNV